MGFLLIAILTGPTTFCSLRPTPSSRTFWDDRNPCYFVLSKRAMCGYQALEMWFIWMRNWIFNFSHICLVATVLDIVALHFIFTMNDVTIHLVDQTKTLAIAPQFLIWGTSILIYWLYTFFFIVYLELAYWRPKYIIKKLSGSWLPRIQIP